MSDESWNEQKHAVRRKGEMASTKMLFPIMLIFLGILIMIMLPITTNGIV
jgi:tight adherence protein C